MNKKNIYSKTIYSMCYSTGVGVCVFVRQEESQ